MKIFSRKEERGLSMNIQQDSYLSILIREDYTLSRGSGKQYRKRVFDLTYNDLTMQTCLGGSRKEPMGYCTL